MGHGPAVQSSTVALPCTSGPVRRQLVPARGVVPSESAFCQGRDPGLPVFVMAHRTRSVFWTRTWALPSTVAPATEEE